MRTVALLLTTALMITLTSTASAEIAWQSNLRAAHAQAEAQGKLLLLHFYSDNCVWCERLEVGAFKSAEVGQAVSSKFVPVKIHGDKNQELTQMFKVKKFPTDVIVTTQGQTLAHSVSPQQPSGYVGMLSNALAAHAKMPPAQQVATTQQVAQPAASTQLPVQIPSANSQLQSNQFAGASSAPAAGPLSGGATAQLASSRTADLTLGLPTGEDATPQLAAANPTPPAEVAAPIQQAPMQPAPAQQAPAQQAPAQQAPVASQQMTEKPDLAMQGFCPVTVIKEDRWVEGNPKFGVIHLGKLYLFSDTDAMQTFLADPVPYTPVLNEIDVVRFFEERKIVQGKREWGLKDPTHNRMFFFADEAAMNHFWNEYERYTGAAIEVMEKAVRDANPGT